MVKSKKIERTKDSSFMKGASYHTLMRSLICLESNLWWYLQNRSSLD